MSDRVTILLAAIADEIKPTVKRLALTPASDRVSFNGASLTTQRGRAGELEVVAVTCGIGADRVTAGLAWACEQHDVAQVVHLGFAGGLDPSLNAGDAPPISQIMTAMGEATQFDVNGQADAVSLLTLDYIADSPQVKAELHEQHRAALVDMESFHVAQTASDRGIPYTPIRAVSDTADMALPADAVKWVKPDGSPDIAAATRYVMMRPTMMRLMMKLQQHAKSAANALADRVEAMLAG